MTIVRRTFRNRSAGLTVAAAAALALTLGGCTSGSDGDAGAAPSASVTSPSTELSAFQVVQASAQQSKEAGSAKFALTMTTDAGGQSQDITGEGAFTDAGAFEMTMSLPAEVGGSLQLRLVDGVMYLSGAPLTGEGQWMKMPLDGMAGAGLNTAQMDPSAQLEQLQAVADDVKEVEPTTVRGVQARGFSGTIDPQKAYDLLPPEQQNPEAEKALQESGVTSVPFTLYVDDQNRPVRMTQEVSSAGAAGEMKVNISMDFYDWGSDVQVQAPDAASVIEAPAGLAGAGQGA
ncbi:DUF6612 family protein [Kineococcus gynurae]|uniref:DUF6612 family protein n=1 Tax=Kineococcus gynurae TaxID=452979 RepID=A0ABV5LQY0_9ACTN